MTRSSTSRRYLKPVALAAAAALIAGVGAFASFTDTESATRSVAAGQLDIEVGPEVLSVTEMAPGDWMSRGLAIDIDADNNNGNLIEAISLDLFDSTFDRCVDVNAGSPTGPNGDPYVCEDDGAHLMDGNALDMAILACPNGGQIFDANPTDDDDGDPSTDPRMDGPGPYTCVVDGEEVPFLVSSDYGLITEPDDTYRGVDPNGPHPAGAFGYSASLTPRNTGAMSVDIERPRVDEWSDPDGSTHQEFFPVETFADGQTLELVTCISMPSDIMNRSYFGDMNGSDKEDNDYENLSADLRFNWTAHQRAGVAQTVGSGPGSGPFTDTAESCDRDTWTAPEPGAPWEPGDNTIQLFGFVDRSCWVDDVQFLEDEVYSPPCDELREDIDLHIRPSSGSPNDGIVYLQFPLDENGFGYINNLPDGEWTLSSYTGMIGSNFLTPNAGGPDDISNHFEPAGGIYDGEVTVTLSGGQTVRVNHGSQPMGLIVN